MSPQNPPSLRRKLTILARRCARAWTSKAREPQPAETNPATAPNPPNRLRNAAHTLQRSAHQARRAAAQNPAWTLATATGTLGIILLFLLQISSTPAASLALRTQPNPKPADGNPRKLTALLDASFAAATHDEADATFQTETPPAQDDSEALPDWHNDPDPFANDAPAPSQHPPSEEPIATPPAHLNPDLDIEIARIEPPFDPAAEESRQQPFVVESSETPDVDLAAQFPGPTADEPWTAHDPLTPAPAPGHRSYLEQLTPAELADLRAQAETNDLQSIEPQTSHASAEPQLVIQRTPPAAANAGAPLDYEILISNPGNEPLGRISIAEQLPAQAVVTDVHPLALLDNGTLRWTIPQLAPGAKQRLSIQLVPHGDSDFAAVTHVSMTAAVAASTLVEGTKLKFEMLAPERVAVGQDCPIRFKVTNVGAVAAADLVIRDDLPDELAYHRGKKLDYRIPRLAPGESHAAQLTPRAVTAGQALNRAELTAAGRLLESAAAQIDITNASPQSTPPRVTFPQHCPPCIPCHTW